VRLLILDTSFLVAFLRERDEFHSWSVTALKAHDGRLVTCEAVLAETCHLLRDRLDARKRLLASVAQGNIGIPFALAEEAAAIEKLMDRYRNIPMSLADACLVRMAEVHKEALVFTLDKDFKIYRKSNRQVIASVMPDRERVRAKYLQRRAARDDKADAIHASSTHVQTPGNPF
jgi:predicted nucleic acid-binding protein